MNGQTNMNNNQNLSAKEQSIATISALTAKGDLENLRKALRSLAKVNAATQKKQ
jgi:hypothetical protein